MIKKNAVLILRVVIMSIIDLDADILQYITIETFSNSHNVNFTVETLQWKLHNGVMWRKFEGIRLLQYSKVNFRIHHILISCVHALAPLSRIVLAKFHICQSLFFALYSIWLLPRIGSLYVLITYIQMWLHTPLSDGFLCKKI